MCGQTKQDSIRTFSKHLLNMSQILNIPNTFYLLWDLVVVGRNPSAAFSYLACPLIILLVPGEPDSSEWSIPKLVCGSRQTSDACLVKNNEAFPTTFYHDPGQNLVLKNMGSPPICQWAGRPVMVVSYGQEQAWAQVIPTFWYWLGLTGMWP